MITTQNPSEFYDKAFGTGESITGTNADLSELDSQLKAIDDKISVLSEKIESKKLEIEAITSGKSLSDLDRAAREEYVRTGSSSAMQGIENSRLSREMTAKTQADINEETLGDTVKQIKGIEADLTEMYKNGSALTSTERRDFLKSYAEYERLAKKLKDLHGKQYNDENGNGIDDSFEDMKKTVGGTTDDLTDKPKSGTKVEPANIENTAMFLEQMPNYTADEQAKARETLAKLYGPKNAKIKDGVYSLDLDQNNVATNKAALEKAGFNVYSFKDAKQSYENKSKSKDMDALKTVAIKSLKGSSRTKGNWRISKNSQDLIDALDGYNKKYKSNLSLDSLGSLIGVK
jgi:hypothetical protein